MKKNIPKIMLKGINKTSKYCVLFAGLGVLYGLVVYGVGAFLPDMSKMFMLTMTYLSLVFFGASIGLMFSMYLIEVQKDEMIDEIKKGEPNGRD